MDGTSLLPLITSREPDTLPPVRTWHLHRGDVADPRLAVRMNDAAGKWVLILQTAKRPMELYDLSADLSQKTNLVAGLNAPRALPADHPQHARVPAMQAWLNAHDQAGEPRTTELFVPGK